MRRASFSIATALLLAAPSAFAQDKAACLAATAKAQDLRDVHKLLATRAQLQICAASSCPTVVQNDCRTWLDEVEVAIPTVAISAVDDTGAALVNVKVWVDGKAFATRLGRPLELDPGRHRLHFEGATGGTSDKEVTLVDGEKNKPLSIVLSRPTDATAAPEEPPPDPHVDEPDAPTEASSASPLRTAGWILGGVGLGGLVLGGVFGALAIDSKATANCDSGNLCDADGLQSARSFALGSTTAFIIGGVLVATGITLVLVAPKTGPKPTARVDVAPLVGSTWGAALVGRF